MVADLVPLHSSPELCPQMTTTATSRLRTGASASALIVRLLRGVCCGISVQGTKRRLSMTAQRPLTGWGQRQTFAPKSRQRRWVTDQGMGGPPGAWRRRLQARRSDGGGIWAWPMPPGGARRHRQLANGAGRGPGRIVRTGWRMRMKSRCCLSCLKWMRTRGGVWRREGERVVVPGIGAGGGGKLVHHVSAKAVYSGEVETDAGVGVPTPRCFFRILGVR